MKTKTVKTPWIINVLVVVIIVGAVWALVSEFRNMRTRRANNEEAQDKILSSLTAGEKVIVNYRGKEFFVDSEAVVNWRGIDSPCFVLKPVDGHGGVRVVREMDEYWQKARPVNNLPLKNSQK